MKSVVFLSLVLLISGVAQAKVVEGIDCDNAMTQYEMNVCAGADSDKADVQLNKTYKQLTDLLQKDRPALQALIKSERQWIKYRDSQCESETADSVGGSIHSMELSGCIEDKTIVRTKELKRMIAKRQNR